MYKKRYYRTSIYNSDLTNFKVRHYESDLFISANSELKKKASEFLCFFHDQVRSYCRENPEFEKSLKPLKINRRNMPQIIKNMLKCSAKAGVGPMASVAGAIAEGVGRKLMRYSKDIIVENGGDIFIASEKKRKIGIFAGIGNVFNKLTFYISPEQTPCGICTSSAKIGHSLSFGNTQATIIIAKNTALADAYATAFGNMIKTDKDIHVALNKVKGHKDIIGSIFITSSKIGSYGKITFDVLDN